MSDKDLLYAVMDNVATLILVEHGVACALEFSYIGVMADDHIQITQLGYLLHESDMAGMKPVKTSGNYHLLLRFFLRCGFGPAIRKSH